MGHLSEFFMLLTAVECQAQSINFNNNGTHKWGNIGILMIYGLVRRHLSCAWKQNKRMMPYTLLSFFDNFSKYLLNGRSINCQYDMTNADICYAYTAQCRSLYCGQFSPKSPLESQQTLTGELWGDCCDSKIRFTFINKLGHHWSNLWPAASSMLCHYLNQCQLK